MIPKIRTPSLEYTVTLKGKNVIKKPKPGFGFKVKTDAMRLKNIGTLAPQTRYDKRRNILVQEAVHGRFATEKEVRKVSKMVEKKGYRSRGMLPHDIIVTPKGKYKVIDVGNFERI